MTDGRMVISGLDKTAQVIEKIWTDDLGRGVSEKIREASQGIARVESRREIIRENLDKVIRFLRENYDAGDGDQEEYVKVRRRGR